METLSEVELLLEASPVLALPPLVLPLTVALPLIATWWLLLLKRILLLFLLVKLFILNWFILLYECGPVVFILLELECAEAIPTKLAALKTVPALRILARFANVWTLIISPPFIIN
jgi:hypothetical protein